MITEYNSKQKTSSSSLKYSNVNLFNKRESKKKYRLSKSRNKNNDIYKDNNYYDNRAATLMNFYPLKNIFSSLSIDNKENYFEKLITERPNNKKLSFSKNKLSDKISFTQRCNKVKTSSNLFNKCSRLLINNDENKYTNSYNSATKNDDIKILIRLQKESNYISQKTHSNSQSCRTLIECKDKYLTKHNISPRNYLDQILEQKLEKYTSNNKKEIKQKLDENYRNKIESIEDKMKSLNKMEMLYNNKFNIKLNDYIKFIFNFKEIEKNKLLFLQNKVIKYQNKIADLNKKIQKTENEKCFIFKWINLQIQLFEINNNTYKKNKESSEIKERKSVVNVIRDKSPKRKSIRRKNTLIKNKNEEKNKNQEKNKNNKNSSNKKIEESKISTYKNKLLFETPTEFFDKIKEYEYQILKHLSYNNQIKSQTLNLKRKLKEIIIEKNNFEKYMTSQISQTEIILQNLKSKNESLITQIFLLKNNDRNSEKTPKIIFNKKNILSKTEMHFVKKCDLDLVYKKIRNLFNYCKSVAPEKIIAWYNDKQNSKENEIISILEFLEVFVIYLRNKIDEYKNSDKFILSLKELQLGIEKKRRIVNNIRKITKEKEKADYLKKNIENRNNKILFIPLRKMGLNDARIYNKKYKKCNSSFKNIQKKSLFEEYLLYSN